MNHHLLKDMPSSVALLVKEVALALLEFSPSDSPEGQLVAAITMWRKIQAYLKDTKDLDQAALDKYPIVATTQEAMTRLENYISAVLFNHLAKQVEEKGPQEAAGSSVLKSISSSGNLPPEVSSMTNLLRALVAVSDADLEVTWAGTDKDKILDPLKAKLPLFVKLQGFSKEFGKKLVPDKFKLVEDFLITYASTLKDFIGHQHSCVKKNLKALSKYRPGFSRLGDRGHLGSCFFQ